MKKIKLYQLENCPYCIRVRQALDEKNIEYETVDVPPNKQERKKVIELSGQTDVPVMLVEEKGKKEVIFDDDEIIPWIEKNYG